MLYSINKTKYKADNIKQNKLTKLFNVDLNSICNQLKHLDHSSPYQDHLKKSYYSLKIIKSKLISPIKTQQKHILFNQLKKPISQKIAKRKQFNLTRRIIIPSQLPLAQQIRKVILRKRKSTYKPKINAFQHYNQLRDGEKYLSLRILKQNFQIFSYNPQQINNRLLLSININPSNNDNQVTWDNFNKFLKIISMNISLIQSVPILVEFFYPRNGEQFQKQKFLFILHLLTYKIDKYVQNRVNKKKQVFWLIKQKMRQLNLSKDIQGERDKFREWIFKNQIIYYIDFISLIADNF